MTNIEIKARCPDLDRARDTARRLGAREAGVLLQTDVYFQVARGRLKLRMFDSGPGELIYYERPDDRGLRRSDYFISPVEDPVRERAVLESALGVPVIVRKRRELWLLDGIRIHLDDVDELGRFVEFEVLVREGESEEERRGVADRLCTEFGVARDECIGGSYADLLAMPLTE